MSIQPNQSRRIQVVFGCLAALIAGLAAYQYGLPWIEFHHDKLVVHDCRVRSETLPIGAKYNGRIDELMVVVGQQIKAGDVIARINSDDLDAKQSCVEASIRLAESKYKARQIEIKAHLQTLLARKEYLKSTRDISSRKHAANETQIEWIQKAVVRTQKMSSRGSVSELDLETNLRELHAYKGKSSVIKGEIISVKCQMDVLDSEIKELADQQSSLKVLQQEIAVAKSALNEICEKRVACTIHANAAGTVTHILKGPGSSVRVGDAILRIRSDHIWCEAWVDETQIAEVEIDAAVEIHLRAMPDHEIAGRVRSFLPVQMHQETVPLANDNPILRESAKLCVQIALEKNEFRIVPGMTGTAAIAK